MPYNPLDMAEAFIKAGELRDALDALNQHLESIPGDETARRLRAAVQMRLPGEEHLQAALADLSALAAPTAEDYVQCSVILQSQGDWKSASGAMMRARGLKPEDERITEQYIYTLQMSGSLATARALVESLPKTWRWLALAGDLAAQAGDHETAVDCYSAALAHLGSKLDTTGDHFAVYLRVTLLSKRASSCRASNQLERAEADYRLLETLAPTDPTFPFFRGLIAGLRGDLTQAEAICRSVMEKADATLQTMLRDILQADPRCTPLAEKLLSELSLPDDTS